MHVSRIAWALALIAALATIPAAGASDVVILRPPTAETATPALPDAATATAALPTLPDPASIASEQAAAVAARIAALLESHPELPPDVQSELKQVVWDVRRLAYHFADDPQRLVAVGQDAAQGTLACARTISTDASGPVPCASADNEVYDTFQQQVGRPVKEAISPVMDRAHETVRQMDEGQVLIADAAEGARAIRDCASDPASADPQCAVERAQGRGWSAFARWFGYGR